MLKKERVYAELRRRIFQGEYLPGQRLPGEIALSEQLSVSRITLRSALQELADDGLIEINGHSGNYVSTRIGGERYLYIAASEDVNGLNISDIYLSGSLREKLAEAGNKLELITCYQLADFIDTQWNHLLKLNPPDGIILHGGDFSGCRRILEAFKKLPTNTVIIGAVKADGVDIFPERPTVQLPGSNCLADGVRHLKKLGHQRIASIFPHANDFRGFTPELYQEFLTCCGLPESCDLVRVAPFPEIEKVVRQLMFAENPPTAFMCYCDATAQMVYNGLHKLNFNIPQQVSVLGICGYAQRLYMVPPLSVVNFHYDWTVQLALDLLYKLKNCELSTAEQRLISSYEIVEQGSTAPLGK